MREFRNKVVVITGAASGIGRGLAMKSVQEGMKVVLADIEKKALEQTQAELKAIHDNVLAIQTDVSNEADIKALAQKTIDAFGGVHLLFNNAGVIIRSPVWEMTHADWQWVMGVNLWGVIYGIKVFIPIMLKQNSDCHIVNTASIAGLSTVPNISYAMTKHGVVGLTEALYLQLKQIDAKIKVSLLCPGLIKTRIFESARNRPGGLRNESVTGIVEPELHGAMNKLLEMQENAMTPMQYADRVFSAIREEKFYVLSDEKYIENVVQRMEVIRDGKLPQLSKYFP